jgi:hypothetical protein
MYDPIWYQDSLFIMKDVILCLRTWNLHFVPTVYVSCIFSTPRKHSIYQPTSCVRKALNTNSPLLIDAIYLIRPFHDNVDVYNISHFPGRRGGYNCHFSLTQKTGAQLQQLSCMRGSVMGEDGNRRKRSVLVLKLQTDVIVFLPIISATSEPDWGWLWWWPWWRWWS